MMPSGPAARTPWGAFGFNDAEVAAWEAAGITHAGLASRWRRAGVTDPADLPVGFTEPEEWNFTVREGLPVTPPWGRVWRFADGPFARLGHSLGHSPQTVIDLACALWGEYTASLGDALPMPDRRHQFMFADGREMAGLDWADVVVCMRAGMSSTQAREFVGSGADMDPVRLLAALSNTGRRAA